MKFPRQARLSGAEEFGAVFSRPKVSRDAHFRVLSRSNDLSCSRLGMAVSRRVCQRASGRNRLKRIVRESFRAQVRPGGSSRDYVVLPTAQAAAAGNDVLFASLREHWRRHRLGDEKMNQLVETPPNA